MTNLIIAIIIRITLMNIAYISFISNSKAYAVLTLISEILNLGRMYPAIYIVKVVVDMHREMMKIILFNK